MPPQREVHGPAVSDSAKWQRSGQLDSWPLLWAWLETKPLPPPQLGEQYGVGALQGLRGSGVQGLKDRGCFPAPLGPSVPGSLSLPFLPPSC